MTFTPGQTSKNISITIHNDGTVEADETIEVTLTGATNATLGSTTVHTYTILDNDIPTTGVITDDDFQTNRGDWIGSTFSRVDLGGDNWVYRGDGGAQEYSWNTTPLPAGVTIEMDLTSTSSMANGQWVGFYFQMENTGNHPRSLKGYHIRYIKQVRR